MECENTHTLQLGPTLLRLGGVPGYSSAARHSLDAIAALVYRALLPGFEGSSKIMNLRYILRQVCFQTRNNIVTAVLMQTAGCYYCLTYDVSCCVQSKTYRVINIPQGSPSIRLLI